MRHGGAIYVSFRGPLEQIVPVDSFSVGPKLFCQEKLEQGKK